MPTRWKIYFFIIALQTIGVPAGAILLSDIKIMDVVNWVFVIAGVVGLFGFVYRRPILSQGFWKGFAPLIVLWDIVFLILWLPAQESYTLGDRLEMHTLLIFLFLLPQYIGLFRYGYNDEELWVRGSAT